MNALQSGENLLRAVKVGTILDQLHKLEGAPWGDWYGRLLNARDVANMLRPYGVHAVNV